MKIQLYNSTLTAEIDEADSHLLAYRWRVEKKRNKTYAVAKVNGVRRYLHRVVMASVQPLGREQIVDHHPDPNGLNCRRTNLRLCTRSQNMGNSKAHADRNGRYKGVSFDKAYGKYSAKICKNRQHIRIGRFETAIEAAKAYDAKAVELFGIYAKINFPIT